MSRNLINSSQYDSLAANASRDATQKMASVASAASAAIKELATLMSLVDANISVSSAEPSDEMYWFYIEDMKEKGT